MKIAVLGAGNGGQSIAADLVIKGYDVNIFNRTKNRIQPIIENGGIEVVGDILEGFAEIKTVTTNIKEAIEGVELIVAAVPTTAARYLAESCAPYLEDNQTIFLNPGHTGGALEFTSTLNEHQVRKDVKVCEAASLSFICRLVGPAQVRISYRSQDLLFSALPSTDTPSLFEYIEPIFPGIVPASNVMETGLDNGNAVLHPPGMLMNAGWIEFTQGDFKFYYEGITESVGKVIKALDDERIKLANKFGFNPLTYTEHAYKSGLAEVQSDSVYETIQSEEANKFIKTESNLQGRYVEEDVGYGLVPMALIGDIIGVQTPIMDSLINIANIVNEKNYYETGRNLEKMGMSGLKNIQDIICFIDGK
jgi:opine dehydrogenase